MRNEKARLGVWESLGRPTRIQAAAASLSLSLCQLILTTGELCNNSISIFLQCFFRGILCNTNLRCNISIFFNTFQEDFDQMLNFSSRCNTRCSTLQHIQVDATLQTFINSRQSQIVQISLSDTLLLMCHVCQFE